MRQGKVFTTTAISLVMAFSAISAQNQEQDPKEEKRAEMQKAEELEQTEEKLNERIKDLHETLQNYAHLKNKDIQFTPQRTIFRKGEEGNTNYIEIEAYDFIPMAYNSTQPVGSRSKSVRLHFNGNELVKVESFIQRHNFDTQTKTRSTVVDDSPFENVNDVRVTTAMNEKQPYTVTLKDMANTRSNPLRVRFKRQFYVKHLVHFEKLFRYTEDYFSRFSTNKDVVAIDRLQRSLDF